MALCTKKSWKAFCSEFVLFQATAHPTAAGLGGDGSVVFIKGRSELWENFNNTFNIATLGITLRRHDFLWMFLEHLPDSDLLLRPDRDSSSDRLLRKSQSIRISELTFPGAKFPLLSAEDPDVGSNSVASYKLSANQYFSLEVNTETDSGPSPELVLQKALDRERQAEIHLTLTAIDGGKPARSGTASIIVSVLDANDNAPAFAKPVYKAQVPENVAIGTFVLKLNATDPDEGVNGDVLYTFKQGQRGISDKFSINSSTGDITIAGPLDYEEVNAYEIRVEARDKGHSPLASHCKVLVEVMDVNDNAPDIKLSSLLDNVSEGARKGTVIAFITVQDKDGGKNGKVRCSISKNSRFVLESTQGKYYSLVLGEELDREENELYNVSIIAADEGSPPLSSTTVVAVRVSDVNDNPPRFPEPFIDVYVKENSPAGGLIAQVSARDIDVAKCCGSEGGLSRCSGPVVTTHPDGSWSYSKATQQYDVCFSSDTLKSDVVVFPSPFPPADAELISINGGDTFSRTQTLPSSGKVRGSVIVVF
ncbi:hypothetical protein SRHO_G00213800 [Serrasalmus rhombeus]